MFRILKNFSAMPRFAILAGATVAITVFLSAGKAQTAFAQDEVSEATTTTPAPYAEFQNSTLTGTTNTVTITMLPVVLSNGSIVYKNVTIPITVTESATSAVTLTAGTITATATPLGPANGFKAGNYVGPGGGKVQLLTLSNPGQTGSGATEWTLTTTAGATGCTYPTTATFYVGTLTSNPLYARLKAAGITSTAYSYGVMGNQTCGAGPWWSNDAIIGVSQTGNNLNILSFSYEGTDDQGTPGSQITYTY